MIFFKKYIILLMLFLNIISFNNLYTAEKPNAEFNFALITAIYNYNLFDVQRAILNGADVNAINIAGETPLIIACQNGSLDIVIYLLENGANKDAVDRLGRSAIKWARLSQPSNQNLEYTEIINLLQ